MATQIKTKIKRSISIAGVDTPLNVEITSTGIEVCVPGFKSKLRGTWESVVQGMQVPSNALSYLVGKPTEFLRAQAKQKQQK